MRIKNIIAALLLIATGAQAQKFHPLKDADGKTVMTNAEFSSHVGQKVIFKDLDSGARKAFDVTMLDRKALDVLKINPAESLKKQAEINAAKAKAAQQYREQSVIAAKAQSERDAAAIAAQIERSKAQAQIDAIKAQQAAEQRENQMRDAQRVADLEATRAETQRLKAAAKYLNRTP